MNSERFPRYAIVAVSVGALIVIGGAALLLRTSGQKLSSQQGVEVNVKDGQAYSVTADYLTKSVAGRTQKMLAYNGTIPGPEFRINQDSTFTFQLTNKTDLSALLHSHGVRAEAAYDGSQMVQDEIRPGGSFDYKLVFPDPGVFWYHPHVHEVYEQPLGLYGAFIVKPKDPSYFPPVNEEKVLFLSDLPIDGSGNIALSPTSTAFALMGHYGNTMLVNGDEHFTYETTAGSVVRFYVVNAANARPYRFAIDGAQLKVVGGDNGSYEKAFLTDAIVLGPSERAIVDVYFPKSGDFPIQNKTPERTTYLGMISVRDGSVTKSYVTEFNALQSNASVIKGIDPFRPHFTDPPTKTLKLGIEIKGGMMGNMHGAMNHTMPNGTMMAGSMGSMMHASSDGIEWEDSMPMMGRLTTDDVTWSITDVATGKQNKDIHWTLEKDVPIKIRIENDAHSVHPMQHPIHFHGQRFLVIARNGVPQTNLVWKDTALVATGETIDILLDPSNPGMWMAHCHISEHLQDGMMFMFTVK